MDRDPLLRAEALAEQVGHVFVATADAEGLPHLAAAGTLALRPEDHVVLTEWFCSETLRNIDENRLVGLVVWDAESDSGYQIAGEVEEVNDLSMLDGYQDDQTLEPLPQVERELVVRVEKVLAFSQGPHSDVPDFGDPEGEDENGS